MKILIVGASGNVGKKLFTFFQKDFEQVYGSYLTHPMNNAKAQKINLLNQKETLLSIEKVQPELVIHCAGNKNVDECEKNYELAFEMNVKSTENLVIACNKISSKLIYLSTDYVFKGDKGNYKEEEPREPLTNYGKTKCIAEDLIKDTMIRFQIVRSAAIYSKNSIFVNWLVSTLRKGKTVKVFENLYFSPTSALNLYQKICYIIENWENGRIIHITDNERISRYNFALILADFLRLPKDKIIPTSEEDPNSLLLKDSSLNCDRIYKMTKDQTGIVNHIKEYKEDFSI